MYWADLAMTSTTDFQSFLKNNLTNVDVANIIQAYRDFVTTGTDSNVRKQLKDLYGIGDEALTAYMIDPAVMTFPPVILPVAVTNPPVTKLATVTVCLK